MKHIHLDSCDSTQDYLKEQLTQGAVSDLLVSCENQTQGHGRNQKKWEPLPHSLYFSFTLNPHEKVTWTAIELSVIISDYFSEKFGEELKLKWPNDIYNSTGKKCSGILIQQHHQKHIAGIGINLLSSSEWGGVFQNLSANFSKEEWCADLYQYIIKHRIDETNLIKKKFLSRCIHHQIPVTITEGEEIYSGEFIGLGDWGEAILKKADQTTLHLYNGTLRW
jgi:BirA family biotin operon repressor/biotin-[acetyl-CoA-carboxylase] ligase